MPYSAKIGQRTISSSTPVIVLFADGQMLEFPDAHEAKGFMNFYHQNQGARTSNPGVIYVFERGGWQENRNAGAEEKSP